MAYYSVVDYQEQFILLLQLQHFLFISHALIQLRREDSTKTAATTITEDPAVSTAGGEKREKDEFVFENANDLEANDEKEEMDEDSEEGKITNFIDLKKSNFKKLFEKHKILNINATRIK